MSSNQYFDAIINNIRVDEAGTLVSFITPKHEPYIITFVVLGCTDHCLDSLINTRATSQVIGTSGFLHLQNEPDGSLSILNFYPKEGI